MRILIGCENSAHIRDAFRAKGHDAWSADLLQTSGDPRWHIVGNVLEVLDLKWDAAIFHPPCQFLNSAGMHWTIRGLRDPRETDKAIKFAERLWLAPIAKIAIENPTGCLSTRSCLGKYTQRIQPYHFGEDASKGTCLWLKGFPPLVNTRYVEPRLVCKKCKGVSPYAAAFKHGCQHCGAEPGLLLPRWANQTNSGQNRLTPSEDRWKKRSVTYPGIARAMADQWGS